MSIKLAEQHVKQGNLTAALSELQSAIRDDPATSGHRVFLFQLLCVMGDWNRALTQLNVSAELDGDALLMAQTYRELLHCEAYRRDVFASKRVPLVFGEPPAWMATLLEAVAAVADADGTRAKVLVDAAFEQATAQAGDLDGQSFSWLADADMRLGPVVEAVINGKYYWIPMNAIAEITLSAPEDLRDLVWLPAEFQFINEGHAIGFLPARYPGDSMHEQPDIALGRKTDWIDMGGDFYIGAGQKMWASDAGDHPLLETRHIGFTAT